MDLNEDFLNKTAIKNDLALIKSCLKLINSSIKASKNNGEDFSVTADEKLHDLVTSVDTILTKLKKISIGVLKKIFEY